MSECQSQFFPYSQCMEKKPATTKPVSPAYSKDKEDIIFCVCSQTLFSFYILASYIVTCTVASACSMGGESPAY